MNDFGLLLQACVASGIVLSSLCAMVIVPFALWVAVRRLTPSIVAMDGDPMWQAPLAALAAALPGIAFAAFAIEALLTGSKSQCLMYVSGRVLFGGIIVVTVAAFARACVRAFNQHAEVHRLFAVSSPPSRRLAQIGAEVGLPVRSLHNDDAFCALAGICRPAAFLSTGSERRLNDAEIRAALLHERAHRNRHDQVLIAVLTFATDLLPLPVFELIDTYRRAREIAADAEAVRQTDCTHLASAILGMARSKSMALATGLFSEPNLIHTRLDALLNRSLVQDTSSRLAVGVTLAMLMLLTSSTAIASLVLSATCARMM